MKKFTKIALSSALAVGVGLGGVALAGCGKQPEPAKLEVVQEFKDEYYLGETVDITGALFAYTDEEGKTIHLTAEDVTISGFFSTTAGEWNMVIKYDDTTMLYPYTVIEPVFAQIGVPYYAKTSSGGIGPEICYQVVIFNEDETASSWTSTVLPTINNYQEILTEDSQVASPSPQDMEFSKEIVDGHYELTVLGTSEGNEIKIKIVDTETLEFTQTIAQSSTALELTFNTIGNEDVKVEYGAYYYTVDPNNAEEGNEWYIVYQFTKDGFVNLASSEHEIPTKDNLNDIIGNGEVYPEGPISQYAYNSYMEGEDFVMDIGYFVFHIDKEGNFQNVIPLGEGQDPLIYDMIKIV